MPNDSVVTFNNPADFEGATREFHEKNPGSHALPLPHFPVDVVFMDGTTQTVNTEGEMRAIHQQCEKMPNN